MPAGMAFDGAMARQGCEWSKRNGEKLRAVWGQDLVDIGFIVVYIYSTYYIIIYIVLKKKQICIDSPKNRKKTFCWK